MSKFAEKLSGKSKKMMKNASEDSRLDSMMDAFSEESMYDDAGAVSEFMESSGVMDAYLESRSSDWN